MGSPTGPTAPHRLPPSWLRFQGEMRVARGSAQRGGAGGQVRQGEELQRQHGHSHVGLGPSDPGPIRMDAAPTGHTAREGAEPRPPARESSTPSPPHFLKQPRLDASRTPLLPKLASWQGEELSAARAMPQGTPHWVPAMHPAQDQRGFAQPQGSSLLKAGWRPPGASIPLQQGHEGDTKGSPRGAAQAPLCRAPSQGQEAHPSPSTAPWGQQLPRGRGTEQRGSRPGQQLPGARHGARPPAPLRRAPHARSSPCQAWQLPSAPTLFLPRGCHRNPRPTCDDAASFGSAGSPAAPASDSSRGRGPLFLCFG